MRKPIKTYIDEEGHEVRAWEDGSKRWFKNGKFHRDGDKPAFDADGTKCWYKNGELHRDGDKPAVVWKDGTKKWTKNGKFHRENNPASIFATLAFCDYILNDKAFSSKEYWARLLLMEY